MEKTKSGKIKKNHISFFRIRNLILSSIVWVISKNNFFAWRVIIIGECLDWIKFVKKLSASATFFWSRETLWEKMREITSKTGSWTVLEFGVAWGYTTNNWLPNSKDSIIKWHGFDSFTGLPRAWRNLSQGSFDAKGKPPKINDSRLVWHVGDVEDLLPKLEIPSGPKVIIFDLDIFEPTYFAWNYLKDGLDKGDLLYFDEVFDQDERRILEGEVLNTFSVEVIGYTVHGIAVRILERL